MKPVGRTRLGIDTHQYQYTFCHQRTIQQGKDIRNGTTQVCSRIWLVTDTHGSQQDTHWCLHTMKMHRSTDNRDGKRMDAMH